MDVALDSTSFAIAQSVAPLSPPGGTSVLIHIMSITSKHLTFQVSSFNHSRAVRAYHSPEKEVGHACFFRQIMNREQIVGVDGSRRNQGTDSAICEERQQVSGAIFALGPRSPKGQT